MALFDQLRGSLSGPPVPADVFGRGAWRGFQPQPTEDEIRAASSQQDAVAPASWRTMMGPRAVDADKGISPNDRALVEQIKKQKRALEAARKTIEERAPKKARKAIEKLNVKYKKRAKKEWDAMPKSEQEARIWSNMTPEERVIHSDALHAEAREGRTYRTPGAGMLASGIVPKFKGERYTKRYARDALGGVAQEEMPYMAATVPTPPPEAVMTQEEAMAKLRARGGGANIPEGGYTETALRDARLAPYAAPPGFIPQSERETQAGLQYDDRRNMATARGMGMAPQSLDAVLKAASGKQLAAQDYAMLGQPASAQFAPEIQRLSALTNVAQAYAQGGQPVPEWIGEALESMTPPGMGGAGGSIVDPATLTPDRAAKAADKLSKKASLVRLGVTPGMTMSQIGDILEGKTLSATQRQEIKVLLQALARSDPSFTAEPGMAGRGYYAAKAMLAGQTLAPPRELGIPFRPTNPARQAPGLSTPDERQILGAMQGNIF